MNDLAGFVKHAERFGSDSVYETASDSLGPTELADLSLELQRIDRRWKMGKADQVKLATVLLEADTTPARVASVTQLSPWRVKALRDPELTEVAA